MSALDYRLKLTIQRLAVFNKYLNRQWIKDGFFSLILIV